MWISKIKLTNFKAYQHAEFNFPEPTLGKNIVLLGAINGHGKTSLLEAIYIGLYGKDAFPHLTRAGLQAAQRNNWSQWIGSALYKGIKPLGIGQRGQRFIKIQIEIEVHKNQNEGLRICRIFTFSMADLSFKEEETETRLHEISFQQTNLIPNQAEALALNHCFIPYSLAPLFFYDGEKIADDMTSADSKVVKNGLYKLCGIDLLNETIHDLRGTNNYISHCRNNNLPRGQNPRNQDDHITALTSKVMMLEIAISILEEDKNILENKISDIKRQREETMLQITRLTGGDTKSAVEYATAQKQAETIRNARNKEINTCLGNSLAQALIPATLIQSFKQIQEREVIRLNHEAGKKQASGRVDDFIDNLRTNQKAIAAIGNLSLKSDELKEAIQEAWDGLFYPLPDNCAEHIWHSYLSLDGHADSRKSLNEWGQNLPDVSKLLKDLHHADNEASAAAKKIAHLENIQIDPLLQQNQTLQNQLDTDLPRLGGLQKELQDKQRILTQERSELARCERERENAQPELIKANRAQKVVDCLLEINQKLIDSKIKAVGQETTSIFRAIAHDQQVANIRFNAEGKIESRDGQDNEITLGLSAGEKQIQVMAVLGGLARVSNYNAPSIIDTPFARLDQNHREKLWDYWISLPQQVFLLAQNAEVTEEDFNRIKPHINCIYTVDTESFENEGYKRATVKSGQYFEQRLGV